MKKYGRIESLRRTLAVLLSTIVTFVVSLGSIPTVAFAIPVATVTFKFDIGADASYDDPGPDGYTYDSESHTYTAKSETEISEGATVALLPKPDKLPTGKQFIGWESSDGGWVAGSNVPLEALVSIDHDGEVYTFSAVYNDYAIAYDFDEGKPTSTATFFQNPEAKDLLYDGLDAGDIDETDGYALIGAGDVTPKAGYDEFVGWALEGNPDNMVTSLSSSDFTAGVANLQAIYGSPVAVASVSYCNAYEGLETVTSLDQISPDALINVSGGVESYTVETGEIEPVPTEDDTPHGKMLEGWDVYAIGTTANEKIGNKVTS
ncbi:hypothetical protein IJH19_02800, partial [Candidatus Saccharibacteria bacterium]|nr:hypothetical protein [Candidatus Saccharibacteria bacterium]